MADLYPAIEKLSELDAQPSVGERYLLDQLITKLPDDFEVYFKPVFNGEMIDVVVLRKGCGVLLITVRDWNLREVTLDDKGQWTDSVKKEPLIAPDRQVNGYKWNMFNLHISGLAEKAALNENFRKVIHPFVYFYQSTKEDINALFGPVEEMVREDKARLNNQYKNKGISDRKYNASMDFLERTGKSLAFSKKILVTDETLEKINNSLKRHVLFADGIYEAFIEYLRPRYHHKREGTSTKFVGKQIRLVKSTPGFQKIKGVAGSGKTTMLAARAVNSHLRHRGRVLILTFNKTLRNFIKSRIDDVPENFDSGSIVISNYHSFINMNRDHCGKSVPPPNSQDKASVERHFQVLYSNEQMFSGVEQMLLQYDSIFLDEIQDYEPAWIKIVRQYFLKDDGEMVLYGDEGQNIYGRDLKGPKSVIVQGFGNWERLTRSMRSEPTSPLTEVAKNFQEIYLLSKYDIDLMEAEPASGLLNLDAPTASFYNTKHPGVSQIVHAVLDLQGRGILIGDIAVVCSNAEVLRKCEKALVEDHGIEAMTTFESEKNFADLREKYHGSELDRKVKDIRGSKKFSFDQSSPLLKMSTVHSFKGMDSNSVLFIIMPEDNEEIVYTGMTRAKQHLVLQVSEQSQFVKFFKSQSSVDIEGPGDLQSNGKITP